MDEKDRIITELRLLEAKRNLPDTHHDPLAKPPSKLWDNTVPALGQVYEPWTQEQTLEARVARLERIVSSLKAVLGEK